MSDGSLVRLIAPKSISNFHNILFNCDFKILRTHFSHFFSPFLTSSALVSATRIVSGEHSFSTTSGLEQQSQVDLFVMHPNYDTVTLENDIVLMKVIEWIIFKDILSIALKLNFKIFLIKVDNSAQLLNGFNWSHRYSHSRPTNACWN